MSDRNQDLAVFHRYSGGSNPHPVDIYDELIVQDILSTQHLFVLEGKVWIYCSGCYHLDDMGTIIKALIESHIFPELIRIDRLNRVYNLLLSKNQLTVSLDQINNYPSTWICFRNGMLDVKTMKLHPHDPSYRCINMIPHDWNPDEAEKKAKTSLFAQYIKEWIPDAEDRKMVLQYCGYSMTTATMFQVFLIITGNGGLGKGVFLRLVQYAIGAENCSSLSLQRLSGRDHRFQTAFLVGKSANICGDIASNELEDTSVIKMLVGEDAISAEYKGGKVFSFRPYAKHFFSANRIPATKEDKTKGYYRRLMILHIWNRCTDIPNLEEQLHKDVDSFIYQAVCALHDVFVAPDGTEIKIPQIKKSPNCEKEVLDVYMSADSVKAFLFQKTKNVTGEKTEARVLYDRYCDFCMDEERTPIKRNSFYQNMREKGYRYGASNGKQYFFGIMYTADGHFLSPLETEADLPF